MGLSVYSKSPLVRGDYLDDAAGNNLGHNFPGIDRFESDAKKVYSVKSYDTGAPTYQTEAGWGNRLNNDIDKLVGFTQGRLGSERVLPSYYDAKILRIIIPENPLIAAQTNALSNAFAYATEQKIGLIVTIAR
jgi:hypothetical protein